MINHWLAAALVAWDIDDKIQASGVELLLLLIEQFAHFFSTASQRKKSCWFWDSAQNRLIGNEIILAHYRDLSTARFTCEEFQVWTLTVNEEDRTGVLTCDEGYGKVVLRKDIPFTDLPSTSSSTNTHGDRTPKRRRAGIGSPVSTR